MSRQKEVKQDLGDEMLAILNTDSVILFLTFEYLARKTELDLILAKLSADSLRDRKIEDRVAFVVCDAPRTHTGHQEGKIA